MTCATAAWLKGAVEETYEQYGREEMATALVGSLCKDVGW